jgi:hypothetical protein
MTYGADGGFMKNNLLLLAIVSGVLSTNLYAATDPGYQPATVVSVERHATPSTIDGGGASDAPLQSVVNSYDIGIRLGDTVYRTTYDSAFKDVSSIFSPNHPVKVNVKRHVMYVDLPGDGAVEMAIESRAGDNGTSLAAGN